MKKILTSLILATVLVALLPVSSAAGATYDKSQIVFKVTVKDASVYRIFYGQSVPLKAKLELVGPEGIRLGSNTLFRIPGVPTNLWEAYRKLGGAPLEKVYLAVTGTGADISDGLCNYGCSFDLETSSVRTLPADFNFTVHSTRYSRPTKDFDQKDFWVFPVADLIREDAPFAKHGAKISLFVYKDQAAYEKALRDSGQTADEFARSGGEAPSEYVRAGAGSATLENAAFLGLTVLIDQFFGAFVNFLRWVVETLGALVVMPALEIALSIRASNIVSAVAQGWEIMRDLVNLFFILALIIIGFGTILRIESYNYKKLLVNLIVMALLVNFSLVIGRIIIEIADVIQFSIMPKTGLYDVQKLYVYLTEVQAKVIIDGILAAGALPAANVVEVFSKFFSFFLTLATFITFAALTAYLIIRIVALWVLLVISPFAYALNILPATATYAKQWWHAFLNYAFFAPIIAFFLRFATLFYEKGIGFIPEGVSFSPTAAERLNSSFSAWMVILLGESSRANIRVALFMTIIYVFILAFLWAGLLVSKKMGIVGATAIVGLAERGLRLPYSWGAAGVGLLGGLAWKGTKAGAGFGAEKLFEATGKDIRIGKIIEGWKESRQISREARELKGRAKAAEKGSAFGSWATVFQRYWSPQGLDRVVRGGEKKGRSLLEQASGLRKEAENVTPSDKHRQAQEVFALAEQAANDSEALSPGPEKEQKWQEAKDLTDKAAALENEGVKEEQQKKAEKIKQARILEDQAATLIAPDDYITQKHIRQGVEEEGKTIHTDNWHELVDLMKAAIREGKPGRFMALLNHLTDTFNENEAINSFQYTRNMRADESAEWETLQKKGYKGDEIVHEKGENFKYSAEGAENFRKLIMKEQLGLGAQVSMRLMGDVSDRAEKKRHFNIMRMYGSKNGQLYFKGKEERGAEVSAELDKFGANEVIINGNRLVFYDEVPDKDYDVNGNRTSFINDVGLAYYRKNARTMEFRLGRGEFNANQAMHAASDHNKDRIIANAETIADPGEKQYYLKVMNQLIEYGKAKSAEAAGKSMFQEVHEHFEASDRAEGVHWPPAPKEVPPAPPPDQHPAKSMVQADPSLAGNLEALTTAIDNLHKGISSVGDVRTSLGKEGIAPPKIERAVRTAVDTALEAKLGRFDARDVLGKEVVLDPADRAGLKSALKNAIRTGLNAGHKLTGQYKTQFKKLLADNLADVTIKGKNFTKEEIEGVAGVEEGLAERITKKITS